MRLGRGLILAVNLAPHRAGADLPIPEIDAIVASGGVPVVQEQNRTDRELHLAHVALSALPGREARQAVYARVSPHKHMLRDLDRLLFGVHNHGNTIFFPAAFTMRESLIPRQEISDGSPRRISLLYRVVLWTWLNSETSSGFFREAAKARGDTPDVAR